MILKETTLTLPFIGSRDYLRGVDLFEALTDFLDLPPKSGALDYSIHDFIRTNQARLVEVEVASELDRASFPTLLIAQTPTGQKVAGIGPNVGQDSTRLERPSHEESLAVFFELKDITLTSARQVELGLLEQAVLMNKMLLTSLLPDLGVKWAFTRANFPSLLPAEASQLELICDAPRPSRLYSSRLRLDGRDHGTIYFSGIAS